MQQMWEADPFLQAGAGGAKGRRSVPDYRRAFAACHEAEDRTRREYLSMRSHRQMPITEAPTLKRRDSLMCEISPLSHAVQIVVKSHKHGIQTW
jgi:hypothetical protein